LPGTLAGEADEMWHQTLQQDDRTTNGASGIRAGRQRCARVGTNGKRRLACWLALVPLIGGCNVIPGARAVGNMMTGAMGSGRLTEEELRQELVEYASRFEATVVATATQISLDSRDPEIQRKALRWKLGVVPLMNDTVFLPEPESAYVAVLAIAASMDHFLAAGAGAEAFGDMQPRAVSACDDLLAAARELGTRFLDEREHARVLAEVDRLVAAQPMREDFVAEGVQTLVARTQTSGAFDFVTAVPLAPFRALTGVDEGAQAIREVNETAMHATRIAASMPTLLRWNVELLALDLGRQASFESLVASLDAVTRSAENVSRTAEMLPDTLRGLLDQVDASGRSLAPLAASLEQTASAIGAAGTSWKELVVEVQKQLPDPAEAAASRPFDVREWEATAAQVSTAAAELRALLDSTRGLVGSGELPAAVEAVAARVEQVEAGSRDLIDLAAVRALQLIAVFFVLLFSYRRLESWLAGRRAVR
jgi:hypothetical protein